MLRYNDEVKIKASIVNGQESGQMVMNTYKAFCCETIALRQFCLYWFRLWIKMNIFENKLWPIFKNKHTHTHTHTHTHIYIYIYIYILISVDCPIYAMTGNSSTSGAFQVLWYTWCLMGIYGLVCWVLWHINLCRLFKPNTFLCK